METDAAQNGVYDNTTDTLIPGTEVLIKLPDGQVIGKATTQPDGTFEFLPPINYPNVSLTFALANNPTVPVGTTTTDLAGNANKDIPLPPTTPVITGTVWTDYSANGVFNPSTDALMSGTTILAKLPNGTIIGTVVSDPYGNFTFIPPAVSLNQVPH